MQNRASNYILKNEVSVELMRAVLDEVRRGRKERSAKGMVQQISRNTICVALWSRMTACSQSGESDLRANHIYLSDRTFVVFVFQDGEQNVKASAGKFNRWSGKTPCFITITSRKMYLMVNIQREEDQELDGWLDELRSTWEEQMKDRVGRKPRPSPY